jgi:hypothetical protein
MVSDIHQIINETTNTLFVCAVGNEAEFYDDIDFPARYPGTLAVQAISCNGTYVECNMQAGPQVDIAAHFNVWTTTTDFTPGLGGFCSSSNNCYEKFGGSSSAAPQVTATAAMMLAANPYLSREQLLRLIRRSAAKEGGIRDLSGSLNAASYDPVTGKNDFLGFGILNASQATRNGRSQRGLGDVHWDLTGTGTQVDRGEEVGVLWDYINLNSDDTMKVEAVDQLGNTYPVFQGIPATAPGLRFSIPQSWPDNRQYVVRLELEDAFSEVFAFSKAPLFLPEQDWIEITYRETYCDNFVKPLTWDTSYRSSEQIRIHFSDGVCSASAILANTGQADIEYAWIEELIHGQSDSGPSCGGSLYYQVHMSSVREAHVQTEPQWWAFLFQNVQDCRGTNPIE